jgi:endogenous inhibitor of DNA gyrase (YacG/DUF329 family)
MTQTKNIKCPTCNKPNTWTTTNASRPFCSERCKLIDLGEWADEQHRIAGDPAPIPDEKSDN